VRQARRGTVGQMLGASFKLICRCSRDAAHRRLWPIGGNGAADAGGIVAGVVGLLQKVGGCSVLGHRDASGNHAGEQRQVERSTARGIGGERQFFFILALLLKNREMNPSETYFQIMALLSRASQVGVPCALARLTFIWTSGATSIRSVPPHILVPKMSHII
jgi:hypothetical protein